MFEVIASPFLDEHVVVRPSSQRAVKIGAARFRELLGAAAVPDAPCPAWLVDAARQQWGLNLSGRRLAGTHPAPTGSATASQFT